MILKKYEIDQKLFNQWMSEDHELPAGMSYVQAYIDYKKKCELQSSLLTWLK